MNWLDFELHWDALSAALSQAFPQLSSIDLTRVPAGSDDFVSALARIHDLTWSETREILDDVAMSALARGEVQVSDVTQRMVASS